MEEGLERRRGTGTETGSGSGTEDETESGTETGKETGAGTETGTGVDSGTEAAATAAAAVQVPLAPLGEHPGATYGIVNERFTSLSSSLNCVGFVFVLDSTRIDSATCWPLQARQLSLFFVGP